MKNRQPPAFAFFVTTAALAILIAGQPDAAAEPHSGPAPKRFSTIQFEHRVFMAELDKPLRALGKRYVELLAKEEVRLIVAGDTAAASVIREEIEFYLQRQVEFPKSFTEARRLQGIFHRERLRLARVREDKALQLTEGYRQKLESLRLNPNEAEVEAIDAELNEITTVLLAKKGSPSAAPGIGGPLAAKDAGGNRR